MADFTAQSLGSKVQSPKAKEMIPRAADWTTKHTKHTEPGGITAEPQLLKTPSLGERTELLPGCQIPCGFGTLRLCVKTPFPRQNPPPRPYPVRKLDERLLLKPTKIILKLERQL